MRIVIDLGAIRHRLRCWWWQTFMQRHHWKRDLCVGCGTPLTEDEASYYGFHCERCEGLAVHQWGNT
jgi:hypothetical protein